MVEELAAVEEGLDSGALGTVEPNEDRATIQVKLKRLLEGEFGGAGRAGETDSHLTYTAAFVVVILAVVSNGLSCCCWRTECC